MRPQTPAHGKPSDCCPSLALGAVSLMEMPVCQRVEVPEGTHDQNWWLAICVGALGLVAELCLHLGIDGHAVLKRGVIGGGVQVDQAERVGLDSVWRHRSASVEPRGHTGAGRVGRDGQLGGDQTTLHHRCGADRTAGELPPA